jgi:hypothetical protein
VTSSELLILAAPSSKTASQALSPQTTILPHVTLIVQNLYCTPPNNFGIWKEYAYYPSYDPDAFVSAEDLYRPHISMIMAKQVIEEGQLEASVYTNKSIALLIDWQNSGSSAKSNIKVNCLIHDIILHSDFKLNQL